MAVAIDDLVPHPWSQSRPYCWSAAQ